MLRWHSVYFTITLYTTVCTTFGLICVVYLFIYLTNITLAIVVLVVFSCGLLIIVGWTLLNMGDFRLEE